MCNNSNDCYKSSCTKRNSWLFCFQWISVLHIKNDIFAKETSSHFYILLFKRHSYELGQCSGFVDNTFCPVVKPECGYVALLLFIEWIKILLSYLDLSCHISQKQTPTIYLWCFRSVSSILGFHLFIELIICLYFSDVRTFPFFGFYIKAIIKQFGIRSSLICVIPNTTLFFWAPFMVC